MNLGSLPDIFEDLPSLTSVSVSGCRLSDLPPSLFQMHRLTALEANDNELRQLPGSVSGVHTLEHLYLSNNRLTSLPAGLGNLFRLSSLDVHNNQLPNLPDDVFGSMGSLHELNLAGNQLTTLPGSILRCPLLREVDLSGNRFSEIPEVIWSLPPGCQVNLSNNPLSENARLRLEERSLTDNFMIPLPIPEQEAGVAEPASSLSLPENLARWLPEGMRLPSLANAEHEDHAGGFNDWLNRLRVTNEYTEATRPVLQQRVQELLERMDADPDLRKRCFLEAVDANMTCGDRVTLGLRNMELAVTSHDAELGRLTERELLQLGQGMHRLELLEQVARESSQAQLAARHVSHLEQVASSLEGLAGLPVTGPGTPQDTLEIRSQRAFECIERVFQHLDPELTAHDFQIGNMPTPGDTARLLNFLSERTDYVDHLAGQMGLRPFLPNPEEIIDEAVEVFLAYQVMLKDDLALPVQTQGMLYAASANLTKSDLESAARIVTENSQDPSQQHLFLSQWAPLQAHLQRNHEDEWNGITKLYEDKAESLEDGPEEGETEGHWKGRMDQMVTDRRKAMEAFYQRHTATLIGYSLPTSGTPQQ